MRQWKVDPRLLCMQHLLGAHFETHMFVGTFNRKISVEGYLRNGLLEIHTLRQEHDALEAELCRRAKREFVIRSPLKSFDSRVAGSVDTQMSLVELKRRCPECRIRIERFERGENPDG